MKKILLLLLLTFLGGITRPQNMSVFMINKVSGSAPAALSGMDSLTSGSVSAAATMDISFTSYYNTYNYFILFVSVAPGTDNTNLQMLVSADGTTYANSSGNYNWNLSYGSGTAAGQPDAIIQLIGNCGNTAGYHNDGWIMFQNPDIATQRPLFEYHLSETDVNGTNAPINGVATRTTNTVFKALRLLYSTGTITGSYKLLGSH